MADKPEESEYDPEAIEALSASEAGGVVDALDRNRNYILLAIAGGAILICAALVIGQMRKQKHLEAAQAYSSALTTGEIAGLDAVAVDFGGSIAGGNALLSKAEIQINQGKPQDAQATLESFIDEYPSHPRHVQGVFALGNLYQIAGDKEKARSYYQRAIDEQPDGEITPLARIRLGDIALESGETKIADQDYQEAYTLHPGTPFFDYAKQKITLLAVGNPPVVERPEPPKPEPVPEPKAPAQPKADAKPTPPAQAPAKPNADAKPAQPAQAPAKPKADAKPAQPGQAPAAGKAKAMPKAQPKATIPGSQQGKGKAQPKEAAPKAKAPGNTPQSQGPAPKSKAATPKAEQPKAATPKADKPKADAPVKSEN